MSRPSLKLARQVNAHIIIAFLWSAGHSLDISAPPCPTLSTTRVISDIIAPYLHTRPLPTTEALDYVAGSGGGGGRLLLAAAGWRRGSVVRCVAVVLGQPAKWLFMGGGAAPAAVFGQESVLGRASPTAKGWTIDRSDERPTDQGGGNQ